MPGSTRQQPDQIGIMDAGPGEALDVIKFEPAGFGASVALLVHKGAPASVAFEDDALDRVRDVVRIRGPGHCGGGLPWLPADAETFLLDSLEEEVERLLEDCSWVAIGNPVPEQILGLAELVA